MPRLSRFGLLLCAVYLAGAATTPAIRQADAALARLPLRFEANQGQLDPAIRYAARAGAYSLALKSTGPSLSLGSHRVDISLLNSNRAPKIEALDPVATRTIPSSARATAGARTFPASPACATPPVYPGIDIVYYGNRSQLEYDFVLAPGADPRSIRMRFDGATNVRLSASGDLMVDDLIQKRPVIYQDNPRREIAGRYILLDRNTVAVRVQKYDRSRQLVIDPVLSYLTYMGGTGTDRINAAKLYKNFLYVTGQITNQDLTATGNPYKDVTSGATDIFLPSSTLRRARVIPSHISPILGEPATMSRWPWKWTPMAWRTSPAARNSADFPIAGGFQTIAGREFHGCIRHSAGSEDRRRRCAPVLDLSRRRGGRRRGQRYRRRAGQNGLRHWHHQVVGLPADGQRVSTRALGNAGRFCRQSGSTRRRGTGYSTYLGGESADDGRAILAGAERADLFRGVDRSRTTSRWPARSIAAFASGPRMRSSASWT